MLRCKGFNFESKSRKRKEEAIDVESVDPGDDEVDLTIEDDSVEVAQANSWGTRLRS